MTLSPLLQSLGSPSPEHLNGDIAIDQFATLSLRKTALNFEPQMPPAARPSSPLSPIARG
jgi:hypothetical protein